MAEKNREFDSVEFYRKEECVCSVSFLSHPTHNSQGDFCRSFVFRFTLKCMNLTLWSLYTYSLKFKQWFLLRFHSTAVAAAAAAAITCLCYAAMKWYGKSTRIRGQLSSNIFFLVYIFGVFRLVVREKATRSIIYLQLSIQGKSGNSLYDWVCVRFVICCASYALIGHTQCECVSCRFS